MAASTRGSLPHGPHLLLHVLLYHRMLRLLPHLRRHVGAEFPAGCAEFALEPHVAGLAVQVPALDELPESLCC